MKVNEKMVLECQIDILTDALSDICHILTEIDGFNLDSIEGIYARCAYARGQSALRHSNKTMEGFKS